MKAKAKENLEEKESRKPPRSGLDAERGMERRVDVLVMAYLTANLGFKDIPLKQLMDTCEKKILLDCLHLNHGSKKNRRRKRTADKQGFFGTFFLNSKK